MLIQKRVYEILGQAQNGDKVSSFVDRFLTILIITNVLAVSLESVETIGSAFRQEFAAFEMFSIIVFGTEYILRLWSAVAKEDSAHKTPFGKRIEYILSFNGLVDLAALLPSLISMFVGSADLRWIRVVRILRLLKMSNYSTALEDLGSAIYEERQSFLAALYLFTLALFIASALMYVLEHQAQPEAFASIPESMWWALITLTTVGYGDVSPITTLGKMVGALTALIGVCTVALLTGIIASAFTSQIEKRKALMEAEIAAAFSDGIITDNEMQKIEEMRRRFNMNEEHIEAIIEIITDGKK
ncbi:MAG: ion transporter [PS1 clade bacterium]|uniref:Ion transporter n=1 Tax=PS1 clade bacterium TaxID=2175152 RepID=A0A368DYY5_9PROT|nr:MAG: ion transporter [PS1 clade bacterium]HAK98537.1 potassium channel protein [Rhodobiaceae bacterium]|tara:strand:+ start:52 stop:954 length:903 start_codon:yes stop_codon:yes gene_type:complete